MESARPRGGGGSPLSPLPPPLPLQNIRQGLWELLGRPLGGPSAYGAALPPADPVKCRFFTSPGMAQVGCRLGESTVLTLSPHSALSPQMDPFWDHFEPQKVTKGLQRRPNVSQSGSPKATILLPGAPIQTKTPLESQNLPGEVPMR